MYWSAEIMKYWLFGPVISGKKIMEYNEIWGSHGLRTCGLAQVRFDAGESREEAKPILVCCVFFFFALSSNRLEYFNSKYLQKILLREYDQPKSSIVLLYEKLERKHAIELAEAGQLGHAPSHPSLLWVVPFLSLLPILPLEGTVMESFYKLLCLLCSSLLGNPMRGATELGQMQNKHYLKMRRWVLKMIRWMSNLLALMDSFWCCAWRLISITCRVTQKWCSEEEAPAPFLMPLHYYACWRDPTVRTIIGLREQGQIFASQNGRLISHRQFRSATALLPA